MTLHARQSADLRGLATEIERNLDRLSDRDTGQPHERNLDRWRQLVDRGDLPASIAC